MTQYMDTLLADITNINNITISGSNAIITIPKAHLLTYINIIDAASNANITKFTNAKASLTAQSAVYDNEIATENTNISNDSALITLLS